MKTINFLPTVVSHLVLGIDTVIPYTSICQYTLSLARPYVPVHAFSMIHDPLGHSHSALEKDILQYYSDDLASYLHAACKSCSIAKSTCILHNSSSSTVTTAPLQLLL